MDYGITRIYSPDDGRKMGLQGMINDLVQRSDFAIGDVLNGEVDQLMNATHFNLTESKKIDLTPSIARIISSAKTPEIASKALDSIHRKIKHHQHQYWNYWNRWF